MFNYISFPDIATPDNEALFLYSFLVPPPIFVSFHSSWHAYRGLLGNASFADARPVVANCRAVPTALKNGPVFGMSGMI